LLEGQAQDLLSRLGVMVATSANLPGGPDPGTIAEVPEEIRAAASAIVDVGPLPGTPSTVIDFSGPKPVVLREGAVSTEEALRLVGSVL
jgi:tRNA A37 threonylcarbamoyladenosine synthetase subunit TsaC/SUA5/YrdC